MAFAGEIRYTDFNKVQTFTKTTDKKQRNNPENDHRRIGIMGNYRNFRLVYYFEVRTQPGRYDLYRIIGSREETGPDDSKKTIL